MPVSVLIAIMINHVSLIPQRKRFDWLVKVRAISVDVLHLVHHHDMNIQTCYNEQGRPVRSDLWGECVGVIPKSSQSILCAYNTDLCPVHRVKHKY